MGTRTAKVLIVILAIVIVVLAWFLWTTPASAPTTTTFSPTATTSSPQTLAPTSTVPLDKNVVVTSPTQNESVPHTFTVAGSAPGAWFFEATFPIQVRDADDNLVGTVGATAQGNWETTGPVTFTATMIIDPAFHGPANLILLRDNPSGLPENEDSVTIPIVVQ